METITASRHDSIEISEACPERPYLEAQIPFHSTRIQEIVVTVCSNDQGYCDEQWMKGYGGFTWHDLSISTPSARNNIPPIPIHRNEAANATPTTHRVSLTRERDERTRDFLEAARAGDIVQVLPKARFQGWVNYVHSVELEIHYHHSGNGDAVTERGEMGGTDDVDAAANRLSYLDLDRDAKAIRLLAIKPGEAADPVEVEILPNQLLSDEETVYEALSYSWGELAEKKVITVCGAGGTKAQVAISSNLYAAFVHLRQPSSVRTLWVDQLCIDQEDESDRTHQVSIMGDIYSRATSVIVWLGGDNDDDREAVKILNTLFEHEEIQNQNGDSDKLMELFEFYHGGQHGPTAHKFLQSMASRVFNLPWFWRVWVVQEAWLPKRATFQYGHVTITWTALARANAWMTRFAIVMPDMVKIQLPSVWTELRNVRDSADDNTMVPRQSLFDLVLQGLDLKATNPRDKIFGLLGLAEENYSRQLTPADWLIYPNYDKSCSAVFADFTRWCIEQYGSLKILSAIHAVYGRTWQSTGCTVQSPEIQYHDIPPERHPSWAFWHKGKPKWVGQALGLSNQYAASGNTKAVLAPISIDNKDGDERWRLRLRGVRLGRIMKIGAFPCYQQFPCPGKSEDMCRAFERLFDVTGKRRLWTDYTAFEIPLEVDIKDSHGPHYYVHAGQPRKTTIPCLDKCVCSIEGDLQGLCPVGTRSGDLVVVLYGGSVPYIVREKEGGGFGFVGECYVEGNMRGEALGHRDEGNVVEEEFVLV